MANQIVLQAGESATVVVMHSDASMSTVKVEVDDLGRTWGLGIDPNPTIPYSIVLPEGEERSNMPQPPPINPDVNDIADRAKYSHAMARQILAAMQYRLAELAGTGRLDPDECPSLQKELIEIYWHLYFGTVCAVRDEEDPSDEEEADNTYSDGRTVMIQTRIEPYESSEFDWEQRYFQYLWIGQFGPPPIPWLAGPT
jgi:hypothetical protein